jgi:hypothetical protein
MSVPTAFACTMVLLFAIALICLIADIWRDWRRRREPHIPHRVRRGWGFQDYRPVSRRK